MSHTLQSTVKGVRVDGDRVIVTVKGGNYAARWLCGELLAMLESVKSLPINESVINRQARELIMQTRLESLIESLFNVAIGYTVALASQLVIFPLFDVHLSLSSNLAIGAWFTLVSVIRSYVVRRWFNARLLRLARAMAG
jgi:hypothetical protein